MNGWHFILSISFSLLIVGCAPNRQSAVHSTYVTDQVVLKNTENVLDPLVEPEAYDQASQIVFRGVRFRTFAFPGPTNSHSKA